MINKLRNEVSKLGYTHERNFNDDAVAFLQEKHKKVKGLEVFDNSIRFSHITNIMGAGKDVPNDVIEAVEKFAKKHKVRFYYKKS